MNDKQRIRELQCAMINIRGCANAIQVLQIDQTLEGTNHELAVKRLFDQIDGLCEI